MHRALVAILVVVVVIHAGGCGESPTRQRAEKQEAERRERERAEQQQRAFIAALAAPHGALLIEEERSFAWTADVQETLMPKDGRPVAGIASLSDVERHDESYIVRLVYGEIFTHSIVLMLKCARPTEKPEEDWITRDRMMTLIGPRYAFVAKIDSVRARRGLVSSETGPDVERVGWLAEGRCLALKKVPKSPADETTSSRQIIDKSSPDQK